MSSSSVIPDQFKLTFTPAARREAIIQHGPARFTVLADRLIRLEYHPDACFVDQPSQAFWFRDQPVPEFTTSSDESGVTIETGGLRLRYTSNGGAFTAESLAIDLKGTDTVWHYGDTDPHNLRGTTRTLDFINGYTPLGDGLMSRSGWSVLDDSRTLIFNEAGWLEPRIPGGLDLYFFGYGRAYKDCLHDYCTISGRAPLIPRWALGNWWSRYWHYSQDDLAQLIRDFETYELPFSVCILDMDWHVTQTNNDSTGWTGYTWNRELFPDPRGFLDFAHKRGLKIGLNLHPAEGIHRHEDQYADMARAVGVDPASGEPVAFDIADPAFARAYFEILHHPYERLGVDFWWLDWQQGQESTLPGLDPLWFINHLHFHDLGRDGTRRPFIFSRWGEQGHQRYPIGFSGDAYVTWDTLAFETYMTATASNIAYGWWSHDIGGHTSGVEDPELLARWVQFGALSPINRLHVTKGLFYDRRPWTFDDAEILRVMREALQFRHALLPYLYTMAWRAHEDSQPLVQPMYYDYPDAEAAYHCPQQYAFGSELIAAPYVTAADPTTGLSRQVVWLPEGDWYDFFSGAHYAGDRWHAVYGRLHDMPLFARAGAIVPLGDGGVHVPDALDLHIFAGADNAFTLYEDDGETTAHQRGQYCTTAFTQTWHGDELAFTIGTAQGETDLVPELRTYTLHIHGVRADVTMAATVKGKSVTLEGSYDGDSETLTVSGARLAPTDTLSLTLKTDADTLFSHRDRKRETILHMLRFFKLHTGVRNRLAETLDDVLADPATIAPLVLAMTDGQARALFETLYEAGVHHIRDTHETNLLVLWNNTANPAITYRYNDIYLFFGGIPHADQHAGTVPRFRHIIPPEHGWRHGAAGEHVHRTHWRAQVDYGNLHTVVEQYQDDAP